MCIKRTFLQTALNVWNQHPVNCFLLQLLSLCFYRNSFCLVLLSHFILMSSMLSIKCSQLPCCYNVLYKTFVAKSNIDFPGNQVSLIGNQSKCRWCYYSSPLTLCSEHIYVLYYDELLSCFLAV